MTETADVLATHSGHAPDPTAESIMIRDVLTVHVEASITHATTLMGEKHVRHLVVVDSYNHVEGILSSKNLLEFFARSASSHLAHPGRIPVKDLMVTDPTMVLPETPISEVAHIMAKQKLGCVPVVENNHRLVGFLSAVDLMRFVAGHH